LKGNTKTSGIFALDFGFVDFGRHEIALFSGPKQKARYLDKN
jgi:hypothetical protein